MNIIFDSQFKGLSLNPTKKGRLGFYEELLQTLYQLLAAAKDEFPRPLVAHLVIDEPKEQAIGRLGLEIRRWYAMQDGAAKQSSPMYFACLETRPRGKQKHLHLLVLFNRLSDSTHSLKTLKLRLRKLSATEQCSLFRRKAEHLPAQIDYETGEIFLTEFGLVRRKGSVFYHDLSVEFDDAFERNSYICKVYSKGTSPVAGTTYTVSRLCSKSTLTRENGGVVLDKVPQDLTSFTSCKFRGSENSVV